MSKGIETLRARPERRTPALAAGKLYHWLHTHRDDIAYARQSGASWTEILSAAREDDLPVGDDANARRILQKTWARVCRAEEKFLRAQAAIDATRKEDTHKAPQRVMPSRLPASWRPEFVEPAVNAPLQPVPIIEKDVSDTALQKNASSPTNSCSVASSGDDLTSVPVEGKTRSQIIFAGYTKRLTDEANRKAGYIAREDS